MVVWIWFLFTTFATEHYPSMESFLRAAAPLVILIGMAPLLCLFFWIFLRAISEALYLLMDIQGGQARRAA